MTRKQRPISLAGIANEDRTVVPAMLKELEGEPNEKSSPEPRWPLRFLGAAYGTKEAKARR